ncbi:hypothetical protein [Paraburkholderia kururiensis]|uniref:Uncharacterized protein n=1 Tax=Paraburkholderia kururiensis TaxID=984307 RepID=A0ABZ0WSQ8_9BURK|nr:hypothetical protein [Paraburkholderia kururiensis]WQD80427.1 hypothetical protein U0042_12485 [Paraburkholderia kururiensis]
MTQSAWTAALASTTNAPAAAAVPPQKPPSRTGNLPTGNPSNGPLLAAIEQSLQQLGIDPATVATSASSVTSTAGGTITSTSGASAEDTQSAKERFLVALYQALVLQSTLAAQAGLSTPQTSGTNDTSASGAVHEAGAIDAATGPYRDLGTSLAALAASARANPAVATARAANGVNGNSSDDWEWGLATTPAASTDTSASTTTESGTMTGAIGQLNGALNDYLSTLDTGSVDSTSNVTLPALLEALAQRTQNMHWRAAGVIVDLTA